MKRLFWSLVTGEVVVRFWFRREHRNAVRHLLAGQKTPQSTLIYGQKSGKLRPNGGTKMSATKSLRQYLALIEADFDARRTRREGSRLGMEVVAT